MEQANSRKYKIYAVLAITILIAVMVYLPVFFYETYSTTQMKPHMLKHPSKKIPEYKNRLHTNGNVTNRTEKKNYNIFKGQIRTLSGYCNIKSCLVTCNGGKLEDVIDEINIMSGINKCNEIDLQLLKTDFRLNTMTKKCFNNLRPYIKKLTVENTALESLEEGVFAVKPFVFDEPLSLSFVDTNLQCLRKNVFSGGYIDSLTIAFSTIRTGFLIDDDALGEISNTLESVSLNGFLVGGKSVSRIFNNGSTFECLKILDLQFNQIGTLQNNTFSGCSYVQSIYLFQSGLIHIQPMAFKHLYNIIQLDLGNNELETLPQGLFDDLNNCKSIYSDDNPWNCNCYLQWLKRYLKLKGLSMRCKVGVFYKDMENVEFCPSEPTTATGTISTSLTTKLTTSLPPRNSNMFKYTNIFCRSLLSYPYKNYVGWKKVLLQSAILKQRNVKYNFYELPEAANFLAVPEGKMEKSDFLMWTNTEDPRDYGCINHISGNIIMNLKYNKVYTLCLLLNDTVESDKLISKDCMAIATPPEWANRPWISNKEKTVVLASIIVAFLISLTVASFTVFYIVKENPELLSSSKRVLIVKKGSYSSNVLILPKQDRHQSLRTNSEGYLTPKLAYPKRKLFPGYQERNIIADGSVDDSFESGRINDDNIYESPPITPRKPERSDCLNFPTERRNSASPYFYSNM